MISSLLKNILRTKWLNALLVLLFLVVPQFVFASGGGGHPANEHEGVYGLVFVIMAVLIGASFRYFFQKSVIPFTVLLLLVGILLGLVNRLEVLDTLGISYVETIHSSLSWASNIDPHLLLFVFLPILIFEAAFNMDLHTFKKTGVNSTILAIPGIIVALLITAFFVMLIHFSGYGLGGWSWSIALMFGAVISATDPVAVVAILKELGTSKKLGTLIEGESLLNDGTSIVIFMVFVTGIVSGGGEGNGFLKFIQVAFGGTALGLIMGWVFLRWIKRVYNDALIEISSVIAAAYLTYYLAELVFGVSGVLALVALGLMIGGFGRSRISPNVEHFMEEFWELAGFIANCIIFLIVGIIIATKTVFTIKSFVMLGMVYVIIHISRALMITLFFPLMKRLGYGLTKKQAVILWYGGLRGALALSLGLIVLGIDDQYLSRKVKDEFFFLISGTVTLTLLINATTVEFLIKKLGLTDISIAKKLINNRAANYLSDNLKGYIDEIKTNRYLKKADWEEVEDILPKSKKIDITEDQHLSYSRKLAEARIRLLEKEKSSYWYQFKSGLIGEGAINKLSETINNIIDKEGLISLSDRKDLEISWSPSKALDAFSKFFLTKTLARNMILNRLFSSYDAAVSFVVSQQECLELLREMQKNESINTEEYEQLEEEVQDNIIQANTFIRNLRRNHPKIYAEINTRQAARLLMNKERKLIQEMEEKGILDDQASQKMQGNLDYRIRKNLSDHL